MVHFALDDLIAPHISHLKISEYAFDSVSAKGLINLSLFFNKYNAILLADLGPRPGNLEIKLIKFSSIGSINFIITLEI